MFSYIELHNSHPAENISRTPRTVYDILFDISRYDTCVIVIVVIIGIVIIVAAVIVKVGSAGAYLRYKV